MANKKSSIVFEDPPSKTAYDWTAIAAELRAKPNTWAKVFDHDRHSLAVSIRQGSVAALHRDRGFEVKTRNNVRSEPRMCTLYLRYCPDKDTTKGRK